MITVDVLRREPVEVGTGGPNVVDGDVTAGLLAALKGDTGDAAKILSQSVTYQVGDSGSIIPSGSWSISIPVVPQGKYLWTKTEIQFNSGEPVVSYVSARQGMDGSGSGSIVSVNDVRPNEAGNIALTADDVGALPAAGGDMTGGINMNGQSISGLNDPTEGSQAARKGYVDEAKAAANAYTDEAKAAANAYTDTAKAEANAYTDAAKAEANAYTDEAKAAANAYTDAAKAEANAYTDAAKAEANAYTDAAARKASPRNLLDNSDFLNPVNQRGLTSINVNGMFIDRWRIFSNTGANRVTRIDSNGLTSAGGASVRQIVPAEIVPKDESKYTFAVCGSDGKITIVDNIWKDSTGNLICAIPDAGTYIWAALYEGTYTAETLPEYHPKGYAAELAECQRYYYRILSYWKWFSAGICISTTQAHIPIILPQAMRIVPTVTIPDKSLVRVCCGSVDSQVPSEISWSNLTSVRDGMQMTATVTGATKGNVAMLYLDNGGCIEFSADL